MSAADDISQIPTDGYDMARPELYASEDVLKTFKILRQEDPIHYAENEHFGPMWHVTRYKDCVAVDTDHKRFSSSDVYGGIQIDDAVVRPLSKVSKFPLLLPKTSPIMRPFANRCSPLLHRPHWTVFAI